MNDKSKIDQMARKYKEEMMRIYSKSSNSSPRPPANNTPIIPAAVPQSAIKPPSTSNTLQSAPPSATKDNAPMPANISDFNGSSNKFPSADEILARELGNAVAVDAPVSIAEANTEPNINSSSENAEGLTPNQFAEEERIQGNYDFSPAQEKASQEDILEPLFGNSTQEAPLTGQGYIEIEVSTANGAIPIPDATVIVTQRKGDENLLIRMVTTNSNGNTETIALPAPDISYSETPDTSAKPFTEYQVSVYANGFYTVPEITVPVFSTVKSIQPVTMIPLAEFQSQGSTAPSAADH